MRKTLKNALNVEIHMLWYNEKHMTLLRDDLETTDINYIIV